MLRALLMMITLFLVAACTTTAPPAPPTSIDGEWAYTVIDVTNGNTWDKGTIRFHGGPTEGTWDLQNIYDEPYEGAWTSTETGIDLGGDTHWVLRSESGNTITGDWDAGSSGHGSLTLKKR